jgi:hypothetical protein
MDNTPNEEVKRPRGRPPKNKGEEKECNHRRSPRHVFYRKPKAGYVDETEGPRRLAAAVVSKAISDYYLERSSRRHDSAEVIQRWVLSENWCQLTLNLAPETYGDMIRHADNCIEKGWTHGDFTARSTTSRN